MFPETALGKEPGIAGTKPQEGQTERKRIWNQRKGRNGGNAGHRREGHEGISTKTPGQRRRPEETERNVTESARKKMPEGAPGGGHRKEGGRLKAQERGHRKKPERKRPQEDAGRRTSEGGTGRNTPEGVHRKEAPERGAGKRTSEKGADKLGLTYKIKNEAPKMEPRKYFRKEFLAV